MTGKTYAILGGGGSFGIHAASYLLDHANPRKVIGIGRNPLREPAFSLNIDRRDGYEYHARHVTYELDLLLELLDREKPADHRQFRRAGRRRGLLEALLALLRNQFDGARAPVRGIDEARLAGALHSDRHLRNVRVGRSRRDRGRADQTVEPLRGLESRVRHVSAVGREISEVPDDDPAAVQRLLFRAIAASRGAEGDPVRARRRQVAAARRRQGGEVLYSRARSRPRDPPRRGRRRAAREPSTTSDRKTRHRSGASSNSAPRP